MTQVRLDDIDLKIIDTLVDDGRLPFARVAKRIGHSETTVRARVTRLQRSGAIKFLTEVSPQRVGVLNAYLGISVQGVPIDRTVDALCRIREVVYVAEGTGPYDVFAEVGAADQEQLLRIVQRDVRSAPGVAHIHTFMALKIHKTTFRYTDALVPGE